MSEVGDPDAVADCVRAHDAWFTALAGGTGGQVWTDGPVRWAWVPSERTLHALFPDEIPIGVIAQGLAQARRRRARSIAVWSAVDRPRPELLAAGFEVGWQPWWMTASTAGFAVPTSPTRVLLTETAGRDDAGSRPLLDRSTPGEPRRGSTVGTPAEPGSTSTARWPVCSTWRCGPGSNAEDSGPNWSSCSAPPSVSTAPTA